MNQLVTPLRLVNALTVLGLVVAGTAAFVGRTTPQVGGLFATLGIGWYLGLLLLVAAWVLARASGASPALPVLALAGVVVLSQALTYGQPTVMSAARHVGIIDFIRVNHGADRQADIYQAWSGMFAGIAWVADAAGIRDVLVLATWWPVLLSPMLALAAAALASRWIRGTYRVWFAATVFALTSTTLNVVYFSPQSLGLLLALVVFALASTPLQPQDAAVAAGAEGQPGASGAAGSSALPPRSARPGPRQRALALARPLGLPRLAFIFFVSCAMAVTHQISPYLTVAALAALAVFRLVRPWWTPLVVLAPAVAWALLNQGVLSGFVSISAIGRLWKNIQPPTHSFTQFAPSAVTRLAFYVPALVLLILGIVALITVFRLRNRQSWALLLAAASPAALLVASDYGQEGIFRATLFAGPWLALLVAGLPWKRIPLLLPALAATLVALLAVNVYGQTALDWNRVIRKDTAQATLYFETTGPGDAAVLLTGTQNATPLSRTAEYASKQYVSRELFGDYPPADQPYDAAQDVDALSRQFVGTWTASEYYALVSDSIGAYDERYGFQRYTDYLALTAAMKASPLWEPVFQGETTTLYVLKDRSLMQQR